MKFSWSCGASACLLLAFVSDTQAQTAPTADWTGFYAGAHIGNAISGNDWKNIKGAPVPFGGEFTGGGIVGGLQAGYSYQRGAFVLGLEAEGSFADIDGSVQCGLANVKCDANIEALGTLTGRLGYATGDFLLYGKAGGAWVNEKFVLSPTVGMNPAEVVEKRQARFGVALGGGVEYAFSSLASAKIEYSYLGFGGDELKFIDSNGTRLNVGLDQNIHLVKLGLNYKLTGAPFTRAYHSSPDAPPSHIWDGVYAGVHTGGAFGTTNWKSATGPLSTIADLGFPGSGTADGMIAGGQIGFNRQMGSLVVGGEIDASWSNIDGFAKCATSAVPPPVNSLNLNCHSHIDALGTFAGRLGWAHDNFLIYGKAGAAWANESDRATREDLPNAFKGDALRWGYTAGAGVEYAFTPAWSAKAEYNYLDFGAKTVELRDQFGNASNVEIGQRAHLFKMGLNYRLGADPTVAPVHGPSIFKAPQRVSDWVIETGARYWYSNGGIQKDLYDPTRTTQLNSRLIYSDMNGHSAETFARLDHTSGLFVKGNFGLGSLVNGKLHDEDFAPENIPYSNTEHQVRDSSLRYGSLDVGTTLLSGNDSKLGAYLGYRYFYQRGRGFGCIQLGADAGCVVPSPPDALGLTETEQWRGAALGLNARFGLSDRWRLEVDAAYLPYVDHATVDNHWNRPTINPAPAPGSGWGTQIEAILSYAVTDRFNLGLGGRYWFYATDEAATRFPGLATLSPLKYTSERYGGFLQASYKLGGSDGVRIAEGEQAPPAHWTGWYIGGHLGAGFGSSSWADPFPPPPTGDRVHVGGALGGAQIGVNYQRGNMVVGAELSGSLTQLEGTQTCFGGFQPAFFSGQNCENTTRNLGMLTGRLGYALSQNLFYANAGGVMARENYTLNSNGVPGGTVSSTSATNLGWTVGAGVEHALSSRWSVNAEYKYLDFGKRSVDFIVPGMISAVSTETIRTSEHLLTLGVNYRFSE